MTRMSKQNERRHVSPRRTRNPSPKTGPLKDNLPLGFKQHANAIPSDAQGLAFIPKIK
jgi:hypothetical protein